MAREKSGFLSAFGIAFRIWKALVEAVQDAGGSDDDLRRIETDKRLCKKLAELIVGAKMTTWRTLDTQVYQTVADIKMAIEQAGCRISDWAVNILERVPLPSESETIEVVRLRISELGFTKPTTLRNILEAGKKRGLKPCLPVDGVAIRIDYPDQPLNEIVWLAMEPIKDSAGGWRVLNVHRDAHGLWLWTCWYDLDSVWSPGHGFFFRRGTSA